MSKPVLITLLATLAMLPLCLFGYLDSFVMTPICLFLLLCLMVLEAYKKKGK
ncbi:hypothetical protein SAMN05216167_101515 [Spirosoma endophyticum]|uniref:Uncharacterized protein n=1 Tax=Spirosoma endophyticum TaxID=662367 RepID=A0A1I1GUJ9_9BACT|nr:hypothetical protein SAMN05216167_101515 [Spirosoma endophyticum]